MIGVEKIGQQVSVLVVRLKKDGEDDICLVEVARKQVNVAAQAEEITLDGLWEKKIKHPVLLVIIGHGIIHKVYSEEEIDESDRIRKNDEFIWEDRQEEKNNRVIAFTRKERVEHLLEKLQQAKLPIVEVHIGYVAIGYRLTAEEREDNRKIAGLFVYQFYRHGVSWKELIGEKGNVWSSLVAAKIRLPLLLCLLGLLTVNYVWNSRLQEKYAQQETEFVLLENSVKSKEKLSGEMKRMIQAFRVGGEEEYVWMLDKLASLVPEGMTLSTLAVNPLLKSLEEHKPLVMRQGYMEITGETPEPEKVTSFTGRLSDCEFTNDVKLISLSKNRESGKFDFKIQVRL